MVLFCLWYDHSIIWRCKMEIIKNAKINCLELKELDEMLKDQDSYFCNADINCDCASADYNCPADV